MKTGPATGRASDLAFLQHLRRGDLAGRGKIADVPPPPRPDDLTSLVLRTDFTDDRAWTELQAAVGADATYVSDPRYSGVTVQALVDADAAAGDDDTPRSFQDHDVRPRMVNGLVM